jgi:toxin ParE1/3/4
MAAKPVVARPRARLDTEDAVDHLRREAGDRVALAFVDALQSSYRLIAEYPQSGSARYAHELGMAGVRSLRIRGYPYLVLYVERKDHVDVWRVLHGQRDIPQSMQDPD